MIACVDIICGILLACVRTREVGVSSRNVVSRTFPHFSPSMLTPMVLKNKINCKDRTSRAPPPPLYSKYELMAREPNKNCKKTFYDVSCTIMSRDEHIKSRQKSEHPKDCKLGVQAKIYAISIDAHQLHNIPLHHFTI